MTTISWNKPMRSTLILLILCLTSLRGQAGWSSEISVNLFSEIRSGGVGDYFYDYPLSGGSLPTYQIGYVQITFMCEAYSIPDHFIFFGPQGDQHTIGMAPGGWIKTFTYPLSVLNSNATVSVLAPNVGTGWLYSISAVATYLETPVVDSQVPQNEPPPQGENPAPKNQARTTTDWDHPSENRATHTAPARSYSR